MEELWKDLSLPSTPAALQPYHIHSPAATPYRAADVHPQDYLAGPAPLPRGRPYTALSLVSSSAEFTFLRGASSGTPSGSSSCNDYPFGFPSASASGASSSSNKKGKRVQVNAPAAVERQSRMIKNRESAARSRARKQAYTNELEMELAQLRKENKMLIKREQDFISERLATAAQAAVLPDCSSGGGGGRSRSSRSTLHFELEQRQRCRSAPAP